MVYDTLCLSSGGIYGITYIGALDYLIEEKIIELKNIKNYVGTSIGALFLFFIIIGYTIKDINDIIINLNFTKLQTEISIENVLGDYGINNGSKFIYMMTFYLKKKLNIDDITFKELYSKYDKKFTVIGTNLSKGVEAIFDNINTPDMSVITAIRISISIPIIFTPVLYKGEYYVDGALTNVFPIDHCDQNKTISLNLPYSDFYENNNIFDIFLNSLKVVLKSVACKNKCLNPANMINIYSDKHSSFDFNITLDTKINFINIGREFTLNHVNNHKLFIKIICNNILNSIIDNIMLAH
jgi:predicted acylesterase/phospholipase RssA